MLPTKTRYDFIKNTFFSSIAEFSSVFLYIFAILVARTLGPEDYGIFIFAISFGTIYALFIRFDFLNYLSREIPIDFDKGEEKFCKVLGAQVWLFVLSTSLMIPICLLLPKNAETKIIVLIISGAMVCQAFKTSLRGVLRGLDHFHLDSLIVINERVMLLGLAVISILNSWALFTIAIVFAFVRIFDFIISIIIVCRIAKPKLIAGFKEVIGTIKVAWPFATMMLLFAIYNYCDTIMISFMRNDQEVGYYNIAYQVVEGSQIFPSSITGGLLPLLTIHYLKNMWYSNRLLNFSIEIMFYMAFPLTLFCFIYADGIINFLYGSAYFPSVPALRIIIWSVPFLFLSVIARCAFYAAKQEKMFALIFGSSVVLNMALNFPMIYYFGFLGACVSTIITEISVCIILFIYLRKLSYKYSLLAKAWKPFLVNLFIFGALCFAFLYGVHFLITGIGILFIYLPILYFFKLIKVEDIKMLRATGEMYA